MDLPCASADVFVAGAGLAGPPRRSASRGRVSISSPRGAIDRLEGVRSPARWIRRLPHGARGVGGIEARPRRCARFGASTTRLARSAAARRISRWEIERETFGWNIANDRLADMLRARIGGGYCSRASRSGSRRRFRRRGRTSPPTGAVRRAACGRRGRPPLRRARGGARRPLHRYGQSALTMLPAHRCRTAISRPSSTPAGGR